MVLIQIQTLGLRQLFISCASPSFNFTSHFVLTVTHGGARDLNRFPPIGSSLHGAMWPQHMTQQVVREQVAPGRAAKRKRKEHSVNEAYGDGGAGPSGLSLDTGAPLDALDACDDSNLLVFHPTRHLPNTQASPEFSGQEVGTCRGLRFRKRCFWFLCVHLFIFFLYSLFWEFFIPLNVCVRFPRCVDHVDAMKQHGFAWHSYGIRMAFACISMALAWHLHGIGKAFACIIMALAWHSHGMTCLCFDDLLCALLTLSVSP